MNQTTTKNAFTAKWIWILFLLVIPLNIFSLFTGDLFASSLPAFHTFGNCGVIICNLLYGAVLLKLSAEYDYYKISGVCYIISVLLTAWQTFIKLDYGTTAISFIQTVFILISLFYEITAHSDITAMDDQELAIKWGKLAKLYIIFYITLLACIFIAFIIPVIALLAIIVASIGLIVAGILKIVYLYKTTKLFKRLVEEENVSRETFK